MQKSPVFFNGNYTKSDHVPQELMSLGTYYGYGVFETFLARTEVVVPHTKEKMPRKLDIIIRDLDGHIKRLFTGAKLLDIPLSYSRKDIKNACLGVVQKAKRTHSLFRVRITISAGSGAPTPLTAPKGSDLVIQSIPYTPPAQSKYKKGFRLITSSYKRMPSPLSAIKSANYLTNLMARKEAGEAGADEALLLNPDGNVVCTSSANIFMVKNGMLATPAISCGALPGITRSIVIKASKKSKTPCIERPIPFTELVDADEIFITNSLLGIMPVCAIRE